MFSLCSLYAWVCVKAKLTFMAMNEVTLTQQAGIQSWFYKKWVNLILKGLGGWAIRPGQRWHFILQSQSLLSVYTSVEVVILSLWYHKHSHSNRLWCHEQRFIVLSLAPKAGKKNSIVKYSGLQRLSCHNCPAGRKSVSKKSHFNCLRNVLIKGGWI